MHSSDVDSMSEPAHATAELPPAIERERAAMEGDLLRARELLRDGMSRLHGFFDTLNATVGAHTELLSKLGDARTPERERESALTQLCTDHEQVLSLSRTAILGLQLEDVLGQLLDYTRKRADGVCDLATLLTQAIDPAALATQSSLGQQLQQRLAEAEQRARDLAVRQESLGSGDVELF